MDDTDNDAPYSFEIAAGLAVMHWKDGLAEATATADELYAKQKKLMPDEEPQSSPLSLRQKFTNAVLSRKTTRQLNEIKEELYANRKDTARLAHATLRELAEAALQLDQHKTYNQVYILAQEWRETLAAVVEPLQRATNPEKSERRARRNLRNAAEKITNMVTQLNAFSNRLNDNLDASQDNSGIQGFIAHHLGTIEYASKVVFRALNEPESDRFARRRDDVRWSLQTVEELMKTLQKTENQMLAIATKNIIDIDPNVREFVAQLKKYKREEMHIGTPAVNEPKAQPRANASFTA